MISDSVIFVRNPACNNFHGTSSGAAPSLLPDLDPIQVSPMHHKIWEFGSTSANYTKEAPAHRLPPLAGLTPLSQILLWCPMPSLALYA